MTTDPRWSLADTHCVWCGKPSHRKAPEIPCLDGASVMNLLLSLLATVEAQGVELERLHRGAVEDDKGLDRWCHYQDRLIDVLDEMGIRDDVVAAMERDGWRNEPECKHKATVVAQSKVIERYRSYVSEYIRKAVEGEVVNEEADDG